MLNAIVSGKAGRTKEDIKAGTSWRAAFHGREDLLTASVFERLSYLPGSVFWSVLEASFDLNGAVGDELEFLKFWPRWEIEDESKNFIEPDAYIRFKRKDEKAYTDIILEVKPHDTGGQKLDQWDSQCIAYNQSVRSSIGKNIETIFLAIGGLGHRAEHFDSIRRELKLKHPHIRFYGTSWSCLTYEIKKLCQESEHPNIKFALRDILKALHLAGYREFIPLITFKSNGLIVRNHTNHINVLEDYS